MLTSSFLASPRPTFAGPPAAVPPERGMTTRGRIRATRAQELNWVTPSMPVSLSPSRVLESILPVAASISILLWSNPVNAGVLSGFPGLESVPGPQLPQIDFLSKWNEANQKKYAENDSRFKSSTVLKELLEKSKENKERNQRETQDKYCLRGAEWGVGDCSTQGMTQEEKDEFVASLKKRIGGD